MSANVRDVGRPPPPEVVRSTALPPAELLTAGLLTVAVRPLTAGTLLCAVSGEVDLSTAPQLRDCLEGQIRSAGPDVVVDLIGVTFFSAAGLTVLVEARAAAEAAGVRLCVVARTRPVLLPLAATGLDLVFEVFGDVGAVPVRGRAPDHATRGSRSSTGVGVRPGR